MCLKERADFESGFLLDGGEYGYKKGSLIAILAATSRFLRCRDLNCVCICQ